MSSSPRKENRPEPLRDAAARPSIPLPAEALYDLDAADAFHRERQRRVDEAYEECVRSGGFDHLPGWGKPLAVPTGDPLETILKNANVQPPWVLLRIETRKLMERAVALLDRGPSAEAELQELLDSINKLIAEMNSIAPGLSMHRRKVTRKTLREEYGKWK
jgi:hypothetical protein